MEKEFVDPMFAAGLISVFFSVWGLVRNPDNPLIGTSALAVSGTMFSIAAYYKHKDFQLAKFITDKTNDNITRDILSSETNNGYADNFKTVPTVD